MNYQFRFENVNLNNFLPSDGDPKFTLIQIPTRLGLRLYEYIKANNVKLGVGYVSNQHCTVYIHANLIFPLEIPFFLNIPAFKYGSRVRKMVKG